MSGGLGWPRRGGDGGSPLGWPPVAREPDTPSPPAAPPEPGVAAGPAELGDTGASGRVDDLPMAAALRDELADVVSRETAARPGAADVSRETSGLADLAGDLPIASAAAAAAAAAARRSSTWPQPARCRVLTVANQKGGVGKTTSTVNLAAALAQHGSQVLVVDLDPQGNASTAFGVEHHAGTPSVYDALIDSRPLSEVVVPVADLPGLHCVPSTIDLAGAEIELVSVVARESRLRKALHAVETPYDYVFIDCPPSLGLLTVNALVAAPEVLIPIQCEFYALEGLSQLLRNIDLVRAHLNPDLHVSTILLTMFDARTRLAEQVAEEVRTHFGDLVLATTIPRSVRISEAPGYGQTVLTYDPASRGALAYTDAARELAERAARPDPTSQRSGL